VVPEKKKEEQVYCATQLTFGGKKKSHDRNAQELTVQKQEREAQNVKRINHLIRGNLPEQKCHTLNTVAINSSSKGVETQTAPAGGRGTCGKERALNST